MLYLPFLVLKARKFAMLYSLGSVFIIARCVVEELLSKDVGLIIYLIVN